MANCKIVTYDLRKEGQDYKTLIAGIQSYPNWAKVCESCWIVQTTLTSEQIANTLIKHIDSNDRIFVADLSSASAWKNVICKDEWLQSNLS